MVLSERPRASTLQASDLDRRQRLTVLAICCMSLLIVGMDNTILNVALPAVRRDLHASVSGLQWTIDAYTVVIAGLLLLSGSTADRVGRRRTFQTGLTLFVAGSALCSLAPGLDWLIGARALQAVGGSMLNPVAMSIITNVFTDAKERAAAIGVWGGVVGLSLGIGPVLGGALVDTLGWRSIFWINVPLGLLAAVLAARFVPESRAERPRRPDLLGQALAMVVLTGTTYGIIATGDGALSVALPLLAAAVALVAFLRWERRRTDPLVDLAVFRSVPFSGAAAVAVCAFGAYSGFLFLNTLYLQDERGLSPFHAGLATLPLAVLTLLAAPLAGRWVGSRGARAPLVLSGVCLTAGALLMTGVDAGSSLARLLGTYVLFGLGFAVVNPPITNTAVSGMPRSQAGVASALASTSRQVGAALGVAVVGAVAGLATRAGFVAVAAGGLMVLVLGVLSTSERARRTAGVVDDDA